MEEKIGAIVLAAGHGTRMGGDKPKAMFEVAGKPMIRHILDTLDELNVDKTWVVISPKGQSLAQEVSPIETVLQPQALGTGHAVKVCKEALSDFDGKVFVIFGDTPLVEAKTYRQMISKLDEGNAIVVVGFKTGRANQYGRFLLGAEGIEEIIEYKEQRPEYDSLKYVNSGIMLFDSTYMFELIDKISNNNKSGEYPLTEVIKLAREKGLKCAMIEADEKQMHSANTKEELAELERYYHERKNNN